MNPLKLLTAYLHALSSRCRSCVPLENLMTEAYGISISASGMSSAVAFHNGSVASLGIVAGSAAYLKIMQPQVDYDHRRTLHVQRSELPTYNHYTERASWDESLAQYLTALFSWPKSIWMRHSNPPGPEVMPPIDPTAQLLRGMMLQLPPFEGMTQAHLAHVAVSFVIPSWLGDAEHIKQVASAAEQAFGRPMGYQFPPIAAFEGTCYEPGLDGLGFRLQECGGLRSLVTLEVDGDQVVASHGSTTNRPLGHAFSSFFATKTGNVTDLTEWINAVAGGAPAKIRLAGSNTADTVFAKAFADSEALENLDHTALEPPEFVLALGAARIAKDTLEHPRRDCIEPGRCRRLRRKVDRVAGTSTRTSTCPPKPLSATSARRERSEL